MAPAENYRGTVGCITRIALVGVKLRHGLGIGATSGN